MGVSVIGQLREQVSPSQTLQLRAVVRNEEEASRLRLDMCGAVLRNGTLFPLLDLQKDLHIELCVVPDDADEQQALGKAFEGVDVAVLLSAAHADFISATPAAAKRDEALLSAGGLDADGQPDDGIETGRQYMARASSEYLAAVAESGGSGVNVRVPPVAGAAANRRLGTEVAAAASASGMRHVVLRSSMGVAALRAVSEPSGGGEAVDGAAELAEAVTRMGGPAAIAAQADAEAALRTRCGQRGVSYTVLRLGALVDSSGGVPLAFGSGDRQLLERARLVVEVVRDGLPELADATVDVAWDDKWGMSSAGREEPARTASRQALVPAAARASVSMSAARA
ncbi:hypothetical protein EMIHUDRAFT_208306 [Emiliania huxleyi CCMP1516]|uniref:NAD(P)-binding domain-containing protein n=2 Tax=Emiliania huxleyi TaxID=2903 RepID=A0A0D3JAB9_EMIH1|nr:hypothetical protein EMIHUDRAFT_208306 [Emiliania huxleyi CCMP1516]EOD20454.1 hypothetical protein EMIHUDRAFT_208306 [Emiliania huxleyi CCMP1516]|eukprot:XP_005772883.1 hypothetical protein EMIHUDRAFT_208306 [Emiliania huxleyi CCMP1516]